MESLVDALVAVCKKAHTAVYRGTDDIVDRGKVRWAAAAVRSATTEEERDAVRMLLSVVGVNLPD